MPTIAAPPASADAAAGVRFVDATEASGLASFQHRSGTPAKRYVFETTGSGVALWDFDGDGRLDIYLVNGSTLDAWQQQTAGPACGAVPESGRGTLRGRDGGDRYRQRALGPGCLRRRRQQ